MSSPRHREGVRRARGIPLGALIAAALVGVGITVGSALALRSDPPKNGDGCGGRVDLAVTVAPNMSAPLGRLASDFTRGHPRVGGSCVSVAVTPTASDQVIAAAADGGTNRAAGTKPDVWIPESSGAVRRALTSTTASALLPSVQSPSIASSPVVLAMPRPMAAALGWPNRQLSWADLLRFEQDANGWRAAGGKAEWGRFRVALADPARSGASLSAVLAVAAAGAKVPPARLSAAALDRDRPTQIGVLQFERSLTAVTATDTELFAKARAGDRGADPLRSALVFPAEERDVWAYNLADGATPAPRVPMAAVYPGDGFLVADHPYVVTKPAVADASRRAAAGMFLTYLRGSTGQAVLTAAGFRTANGTNPQFAADRGVLPAPRKTAAVNPTGQTLESARNLFRKINQRGTTLAVIDVSGSMGEMVPGTGKSRLQVTVEAGRAALPLFAADSRLGLWEFSTKLDGARDYRQLVPIGALADKVDGGTRRDAVDAALGGMRPRADTGLNDTALAAYEEMTRNYTPGRLNEVVLLTDGKNDDPGSTSQQALVAKLREEYDPAKPVRLITIAFGAEADTAALREISAATHARSYESRDPKTILDVFINALTD